MAAIWFAVEKKWRYIFFFTFFFLHSPRTKKIAQGHVLGPSAVNVAAGEV